MDITPMNILMMEASKKKMVGTQIMLGFEGNPRNPMMVRIWKECSKVALICNRISTLKHYGYA